ncbi:MULTISPECIES: aminopeptidase [unclassified Fusibacter]|uniref:aminopeptidase n=1 Tax=unclassified Fusibacter TaxID=2624464 RepID=UPI001013490D|nr:MULTISPECIES: aminopeptidase [unclassified Fusibacter]MCK8060785.1 aminopeptidase [Fusibacter sp. A2]NPE23081.1 aminopeptidase [Fusibacter sp. A1]RXV59751.1 aminopeptidase [Fusibacter sp. A1]
MSFEQYLDNYANIAVHQGISLQKGEGLIIRASIESADFVRRVVKKAYEAGAINVEVQYADDEVTLARYHYGDETCFEYAPKFKTDYLEAAFKEGYSFMSIMSPNPELLKDVPAERIAIDQKTMSLAMADAMKYMMKGLVKRTIVAIPTPEWAKLVYPDFDEAEGMKALWEAVLKIVRADQADPVKAWNEHDGNLKKYLTFLNQQHFEKLHFKAPGTDLEVYLAHEHLWVGGSKVSPGGDSYFANIPTEEVFTTPKRSMVNGTLKSTKPLSLRGTVIDGFGFEFKDGKVVDFYAEKGKETLASLLDNDEGARFLGEVALVPHSSPISKSGLIFSNTLFDENASCHFALGKAYPYAMKDGTTLTSEVLEERGANSSLIHVDFMIGGPELEIVGYTTNGDGITLFRNGEWTF